MKKIMHVLVCLMLGYTSNGMVLNTEETILEDITKHIYFYHYAKDRPHNSIPLFTGEKLPDSINKKLPWKFFIHGYTTSPAVSPWFHTGKTEYFQNGEYNVVFVDWSKPANMSYIPSVANAINVGKNFGKFIIHLYDNDVSLDNIHLLGHSLGSHMAGHTGKYVRDNLGKIGRITGLDPAGPFYETNPLFATIETPKHAALLKENMDLVPPSMRLSKDDANFVDIIHTDATHYGMLSSIGHCDFYPNGGKPLQPGCSIEDDNCSHARSVETFVESINSNNFVAKQCKSYEDYEDGNCDVNEKAFMGEHTDYSTRGRFYLDFNAKPPYAQGDI